MASAWIDNQIYEAIRPIVSGGDFDEASAALFHERATEQYELFTSAILDRETFEAELPRMTVEQLWSTYDFLFCLDGFLRQHPNEMPRRASVSAALFAGLTSVEAIHRGMILVSEFASEDLNNPSTNVSSYTYTMAYAVALIIDHDLQP